ncbi:MAG: hypothetical protein AAGA90_17170 [Actinomycetota bacterium]
MALDGSSSAIDEFIADTGTGGFSHLTGSEASSLGSEWGVTGIPFFAFVDGDGGSDTMAGWSAGQAQSKIDALAS